MHSILSLSGDSCLSFLKELVTHRKVMSFHLLVKHVHVRILDKQQGLFVFSKFVEI